MSKIKVNIYTDGASRGNPGPGGYGIVMETNRLRKEFSGGFRKTTNNRMELLAAIVALEKMKTTEADISIISDSKYVVDAINEGWVYNWVRKGFAGKKNPDLWKRMLPLLKKFKPKFIWVKGHNNHPQNERCDVLAVRAALGKNLVVDEGYENPDSGGKLDL